MQNSKGFTLLEVLVAIMLMSILGWSMLQLQVNLARAVGRANAAAARPTPMGLLKHVNANENSSGTLVLACLSALENGREDVEDFSLCTMDNPCAFKNGLWVQSDAKQKKCRTHSERVCTAGVLIKD
jgi:prepilin-type N-terminal cleavage/methylation domain-containing protein